MNLRAKLLKGWIHSERGARSVRVGVGHRKPVPQFAVTELVIYPTARPEERKCLTLGTQSEYNYREECND